MIAVDSLSLNVMCVSYMGKMYSIQIMRFVFSSSQSQFMVNESIYDEYKNVNIVIIVIK